MPSIDKLKYGAIIVNGNIAKEIVLDEPQEELQLDFEFDIEESAWLAFKVHGEKEQDIVFQSPFTKRIQAHSSPIYLEVNNQPTWDKSKAPIIIDQLVDRLESAKEMKYQRNDNEVWESPDRTEELLDMFRPYLKTWIDETIAYYKDRKQKINQ